MTIERFFGYARESRGKIETSSSGEIDLDRAFGALLCLAPKRRRDEPFRAAPMTAPISGTPERKGGDALDPAPYSHTRDIKPITPREIAQGYRDTWVEFDYGEDYRPQPKPVRRPDPESAHMDDMDSLTISDAIRMALYFVATIILAGGAIYVGLSHPPIGAVLALTFIGLRRLARGRR